MPPFLEEYLSFYYISLTLFAIAGLFLIFKLLIFRKPFKGKDPSISFKRLNNRFEREIERFEKLKSESPTLSKSSYKVLKKAWKQENKKKAAEKKQKEQSTLEEIKGQLSSNMTTKEIVQKHSARVYVLTFVGDIMAQATDYLREEISLLLEIASPMDEVVIRLNSPGGAVAQYGLASSQLARLKSAGLKLTICVDVIAASGGYMMASVGDKIVASPFSFIGSIGVVAGVPNFHKVFQKHEIDYYLFTAGEYKRTVTPFAEVTDEGKAKFQENLDLIHKAFKDHVSGHRENMAIDEVATGDYWLGTEAKERGLVDEIMTSDDYLASKMKDYDVIEVKTSNKRHWMDKVVGKDSALEHLLNRLSFLDKSKSPTPDPQSLFR